MMQISRRWVQAVFMAGMLGAGLVGGAAWAADPEPTAVAVDTSDPARLIDSAANALLSGIDKNRAQYRKDRTGLYKLVSETILPNFDTDFAAEKVLGVHWTKATAEQRERFVKGFYHSLLYRYGDAMLDFTGGRFKVFPARVPAGATTATVRTMVKRDAQDIEVLFYLRKVGDGWKAYNMAFEGVNYIVSYRKQFDAAIREKGLDGVIADLEAQANAAKPSDADKNAGKAG